MARYIGSQVSRGKTDMLAKSNRFDLGPVFSDSVKGNEAAFQVAQAALSKVGIETDFYTIHDGGMDSSQRVAVTAIDGSPVEPRPDYEHELRNGATFNSANPNRHGAA